MRFHIFCLQLFLMACAMGQDRPPVPVSPEAAALMKKVDYPVDLNRGVVDISVPLFSLDVGDLSLPVGLSYHSGGFRRNEQSTRSGLGWSLTTDLQVARVVNGKDDLVGSTGYANNTQIKGGSGSQYDFDPNGSFMNNNIFYLELNGDGTPDKFSFQLLGKSGTFYVKKNTNGNGYSFVTIPYENIKITYNDGAFYITDTDGTEYKFGKTTAEAGELASVQQSAAEHLLEMTDFKVTAWKCHVIRSARGGNEMVFEYDMKNPEYANTTEDKVVVHKNISNRSSLGEVRQGSPEPFYGSWESFFPTQGPHKITYLSRPLIEEHYGGLNERNRYRVPYYINSTGQFGFQDLTSGSLNNFRSAQIWPLALRRISTRLETVEFTGAYKLGQIEHRTSGNDLLKKVDFFISVSALNYNGDLMETRYLDSLHIYSSATGTPDRYGFSYYSKFNFGHQLKGGDMWGYVNDFTFNSYSFNSSTSTMPYQTHPVDWYWVPGNTYATFVNTYFTTGNSFSPEVRRHRYHPSRSGMLQGMLKRIVRPGGGAVEFDYEPHRYRQQMDNGSYAQSVPVEAGGLRIRTVSHIDFRDGQKLLKQESYRYGRNEEGTGECFIRPPRSKEARYYNFVGVEAEPIYNVFYTRNSYTTVINGISVPSNTSYYLTKDTVYTYYPGEHFNYSMPNGSPVYYTHVTRYDVDYGQQSGKTVYEYYGPEAFMSVYTRYLFEMFHVPYFESAPIKSFYELGHLKSKTLYKRSNRPLPRFEKVHRQQYSYTRYLQSGVIRVLHARRRTNFYALNSNNPYTDHQIYVPGFYSGSSGGISAGADGYRFYEYTISCGRMLVEQERETSYTPTGDSVVTVRDYSYASLPYLQPSSVSETGGDGTARETVYRYPNNYPSNSVFQSMTAKNMVSVPVERIEKVNGSETYRQLTEYRAIGEGAFYVPSRVREARSGGTLYDVLNYGLHDVYGNVLQYSERDGVPNSILWGYSSSRPVLVGRNLSYSGITFREENWVRNPASAPSLESNLMSEHPGLGPATSDIRYFTYDRTGNIMSEFDGRLLPTRYTYDGNNRLASVHDHGGRVTRKIDYNLYEWQPWVLSTISFSRPAMATISWNTMLYNYVKYGGDKLGADIDLATLQAEGEIPVSYYYVDFSDTTQALSAPAGQQFVELKLYSAYMTAYDYPRYAYVDILKDGHVVASSSRLPFNEMMAAQKSHISMYVPGGSYTVSFRVDPSARHEDGFFTNFYVNNTTAGTSSMIQQGSSHTFVMGSSYEIWVTNF
ncbi:hypothetical protein FAZ15_01515 [Sphingobacterium olei]|uniref:RHS repeat protein n=1 Tax=Sphingobacterium olei TaxID=2571155 RepID=A0A4U0P6F6_9SPHI|nr:RHS repeat protein [Sphingobacterium olei]TJZ63003.1 hypothetical protein FAZ15_01515 [Sphingobacterium olei]